MSSEKSEQLDDNELEYFPEEIPPEDTRPFPYERYSLNPEETLEILRTHQPLTKQEQEIKDVIEEDLRKLGKGKTGRKGEANTKAAKGTGIPKVGEANLGKV